MTLGVVSPQKTRCKLRGCGIDQCCAGVRGGSKTRRLEQLRIDYDVTGKEHGLPRAQRRQFDAA